jgi:LAS superfamily LD-carboxypeptidase LdcB
MTTQNDVGSILTGRSTTHLHALHQPPIHVEMVRPFQAMQADAKKKGHELKIVSGFRGFDAQLGIWNAKVEGKRPVLDSHSKPVDIAKLSPKELIYAILRWSALPGTSRHHWGTDVDVYDAAGMPKDYKIQLVPSEYERKGIFGPLSLWLDDNMEKHGFFRPYETDRGGVHPERWHLSYRPLADVYLEKLTLDLLRDTLKSADLKLKEAVLSELPLLYDKFVVNID